MLLDGLHRKINAHVRAMPSSLELARWRWWPFFCLRGDQQDHQVSSTNQCSDAPTPTLIGQLLAVTLPPRGAAGPP
eukprot:1055625-Pyramimonas_sp.AAC.1